MKLQNLGLTLLSMLLLGTSLTPAMTTAQAQKYKNQFALANWTCLGVRISIHTMMDNLTELPAAVDEAAL